MHLITLHMYRGRDQANQVGWKHFDKFLFYANREQQKLVLGWFTPFLIFHLAYWLDCFP